MCLVLNVVLAFTHSEKAHYFETNSLVGLLAVRTRQIYLSTLRYRLKNLVVLIKKKLKAIGILFRINTEPA
jgi:hypothetical protein